MTATMERESLGYDKLDITRQCSTQIRGIGKCWTEEEYFISDYAFNSPSLRALHQGIATVEILQHYYPFIILYHDSPSSALHTLSSKSLTQKQTVTVWLDAHQNIHPHEWIFAYDILLNECGAIFPPPDEIVWADAKIYDLRAFDRIARDVGTWRPVTCYPGAHSHCLLPRDQKGVMKRSHSCSASHVYTIAASKRGKRACQDTRETKGMSLGMRFIAGCTKNLCLRW
jgi:hypothetical protein